MHPKFRPSRTAWLLLGALAAPLHAQQALQLAEGDAAGDRFGRALAPAGDVDGDGTPDWAVGAPYHAASRGDSGQVRVHSGVDGTRLLTLIGQSPGELFGAALCGPGDVDGDGFADLAVGSWGKDDAGADAGGVSVRSGADGSEVWSVLGANAGDHFGFALAAVGDVDGDGVGDVLVGARGVDDGTKGLNAGAAYVLSGLDGSLIHAFAGRDALDLFGTSVAGLGDLDGDGLPELAVGARWSDANGDASGSVDVFRGSDGTRLATYDGLAAGALFGTSIASAGDLDGDGLSDLLVGSPGVDLFGSNAGCVQAFSSADGAELFRWLGAAPGDALGISVAGGGDVDGDGIPDIVAGAVGSDAGGASSGAVHVFSGRTGHSLARVDGNAAGQRLGQAVATLGDLSGDGKADALLGAYGDANKGALTGMAEVVSFACLGPTRYCVAGRNGAGTSATIELAGTPSVSTNDFRLQVSGARPDQFGVFYYGTEAIQLPFGGGYRCVAGDIYRLPAIQVDRSGSASYTLDLDAPPDPTSTITPGSRLHFQFWYRDPAGPTGASVNFSDALRVDFCP